MDSSYLDDPERLSAIPASALSRKEDEELQALVRDAAEASSFPIALLSMVTGRTQFFKAHTGLPRDLQISRATDRAVSLCQYVVATKDEFSVEDTFEHAELPDGLTRPYGLRAYAGFPVRVNGHVLGSFCVLNDKPGALSDSARESLRKLAERASRRLQEAFDERAGTAKLLATAVDPAFQELKNVLGVVSSNARTSQLALTDCSGVFELSRLAALGKLSPQEAQRAALQLTEAFAAYDDLVGALEDLDSSARRAIGVSQVLEKLLTQMGGKVTLSQALGLADGLALHYTKLSGGVRIQPFEDRPLEVTSGAHLVSLLSIALVSISRLPGDREPIRVDAEFSGAQATVYLSRNLTACAKLNDALGEVRRAGMAVPEVAVHLDGSRMAFTLPVMGR